MKLRLLISLSLLLLSGLRAGAQIAPAVDFFNSGAQLYISNSIPQAKEMVAMGRKLYPDDEKLKKLEELLNQQQQSQQNQQQNQQPQNDQQKKSDDQKNQQQNQPQQKNSQDQQNKDEQKPNQADQKKNEQQKEPEQQKADAEKQKEEQKDKPEAEAQPAKPGQMTPEEAKRLLDAQKGNEQLLQLKPDKPRNPNRPVKDW